MYDKSTDYVVAQVYIVDFCWYPTFFFEWHITFIMLCRLTFFFSFHKIWLVHYTTIFDHPLTKSCWFRGCQLWLQLTYQPGAQWRADSTRLYVASCSYIEIWLIQKVSESGVGTRPTLTAWSSPAPVFMVNSERPLTPTHNSLVSPVHSYLSKYMSQKLGWRSTHGAFIVQSLQPGSMSKIPAKNQDHSSGILAIVL